VDPGNKGKNEYWQRMQRIGQKADFRPKNGALFIKMLYLSTFQRFFLDHICAGGRKIYICIEFGL
jgi:hypothetical protein